MEPRAQQKGRLAGQRAFTPGEDRLLGRAVLRFGTDMERARLYFLPARSRSELEKRHLARSHHRVPANRIKVCFSPLIPHVSCTQPFLTCPFTTCVTAS